MALSVRSANRMSRTLSILLTGCVISLAFGTSSANAQSGLMSFSGAVVAPTCSAKSARLVRSRQRANSGQFDCVGSGSALDPARSYIQKIAHLDTANTAGNRLLKYFVGRETGAGSPLVGEDFLMRTYI